MRGIEVLKAVDGPDDDWAIRALDPLSRDMSRLNTEGPNGDVMSRPGLDLKSRELARTGWPALDTNVGPVSCWRGFDSQPQNRHSA